MKERKQIMRGLLAVITFTVLLVYLVNHMGVIRWAFSALISLLFPFLVGCGIAFVINIPMRGMEQALFKKEDGRLYKYKRPISLVLAYIVAVLFIVLVCFVVIPEVAETLGKVRELFPEFVEKVKDIAMSYTKKYPEVTQKISEFEPDYNKLTGLFTDKGSALFTATVSLFSSIISMVTNILVGIVFSVYILSQKEKLGRQCKMVCYALFKEKTADEWMIFCKIANTTFSKFFTGQFREGIILGVMFMIAMAIVGIPYPITIGVLIGFTALIPVFGAFIGLFIGSFLILVVEPQKVLWFVALFFVLQFIENYFIYPKLVGGDIGLSAIWVLLAVLVGGDLMGIVGMFIFIPLVSVLYSYFRILILRRIKHKEIDVDAKQVPEDAVPLETKRRKMFSPRRKMQGQMAQTNETENSETGDEDHV
ncbi:MAG: AI-2E family transporter [Wujia sp.]